MASEPVQPGIRGLLAAAKKADTDRIKPGQNREAVIGSNEVRHPDLTPDVEAYLNRAYPADEVPVKATTRAQNGWAALVAASASTSQAQVGVWKLIGPSQATYPGVLNVLGDGGAYVASGRITALAIAPTCVAGNCKIYVGAAGGGVWSTPDGLSNAPAWTFLSNGFGTNAIGSLKVDKNVANGNTIFAGTGEPNVSGDSESGVGIYRSTNGGSTWTLLPGSAQFAGRAVSDIDTTPNGSILCGIARAVRGVSSVTGGATSNPPVAVDFGVYRSTDSGATFQQIATSAVLGGTLRGVTQIQRDPDNFIGDVTYYAGVLQTGIWRTTDGGTTWVQIKTAPAGGANNADRSAFALSPSGTPTAPAFVRMYVGNGSGAFGARFFSTQNFDVLTATNATFVDQTTAQNIDYCTGQCWYDNVVYTPFTNTVSHLDTVYLLGSFTYGQIEIAGGQSNGRAVLLSTDGGFNWSDLTQDAKPDPSTHEWTHPDQHAIVANPNNQFQYWEGNDGGLVRSSGNFGDISEECDERGLSPADNAYCKALLNRVPGALFSLNTGLSTLQFQSLSATTFVTNKKNGKSIVTLQGGTQDNGTFQYVGVGDVWPQIMYGDGGQSGFGAGVEAQRFNTFTGQANDVNFRSGNPLFWCVATGPIVSSPEGSQFYPPVISDPVNPGTIFQGSNSVWRTQDWAGNQAFLEANCPEFTTSSADPACGDFVRIGNGVPSTSLTSATWGNRAGGFTAAIARHVGDNHTLWAATQTGRVFFSNNGGNAAAGSVVWERLDLSSAASPGRFVSGIAPVPNNPNIAIVSYSGYTFNTPGQPGHVYVVTRTGVSTAIWSDFSFNLPDFPITGVALDTASPISPTGLVIYASSDFGVMRYIDGSGVWTLAGTGLPQVECAGLTILVPQRKLWVATHGRSAWELPLPGSHD